MIGAQGLLSKCCLIEPKPASLRDMLEYHDDDYLKVLFDGSNQVNEEYGLAFDSCKFDGIQEYCRWLVGGVFSAVNYLAATESKENRVAICWDGGRHHAFK